MMNNQLVAVENSFLFHSSNGEFNHRQRRSKNLCASLAHFVDRSWWQQDGQMNLMTFVYYTRNIYIRCWVIFAVKTVSRHAIIHVPLICYHNSTIWVSLLRWLISTGKPHSDKQQMQQNCNRLSSRHNSRLRLRRKIFYDFFTNVFNQSPLCFHTVIAITSHEDYSQSRSTSKDS